MGRCEGYYKVENRRCDRVAESDARAADGQAYAVCRYHRQHLSRATVARWHGDSGIRRGAPSPLAGDGRSHALAWS